MASIGTPVMHPGPLPPRPVDPGYVGAPLRYSGGLGAPARFDGGLGGADFDASGLRNKTAPGLGAPQRFEQGLLPHDPRFSDDLAGNPLARLRALLQARQVNPVFDLHPEAGAADPMAALRAPAAGATLGHQSPLEQLLDRIQRPESASSMALHHGRQLLEGHSQARAGY